MLQLHELEKLRDEAYERANVYKECTKHYHDKNLLRKDIKLGMKVLLFNSRFKLFPGKLRTRWSGPFKVKEVHPFGVIELLDSRTNGSFKVKGHRVKPYLEEREE